MSWLTEEQILSRTNLILGKEQQLLNLVEEINTREITQLLTRIESGQQVTVADLATVIQHSQSIEQKQLALVQAVTTLGEAIKSLQEQQATCCSTLNAKLDQLIRIQVPPPAVAFTATVTVP